MSVFNVTSAGQLQSALSNARGGDRIVLAAGNYGVLSLSGKAFSSAVTITSADPLNLAHFDTLALSGVRNLAFAGVDIGRALAPTEAGWTPMISIKNSQSIRLSAINVHGSLDGLTNDGRGLFIADSSDLCIENSRFNDLSVGIVQQMSDRVSVVNNIFEKIQSDGIDSSAMKGVVISNNTFRDFSPAPGDHPDGIQFFNNNAPRGTSDVTITDNVIFQGNGTGTQGIFLNNPGAYGYSNVLIKNNLVYSNDQYNGIFIVSGNGVQILDNTVISKSVDSKFQQIFVDASTDVKIINNVAEQFAITPSVLAPVQFHNLNLLQQPSARSIFGNLIDPQSVHDLIAPGYGYSPPSESPASPVASAIRNGISDLLGIARSSAVIGKTASIVPDDVPSALASTSGNVLEPSMPHSLRDSGVPHAASLHHGWAFDHFALP